MEVDGAVIIDSQKSKKDYIFDEMCKAGWKDVQFVTEDELADRWQVEARHVWKNLTLGRNARGLKLPVFRFGAKTRRYRPSDILEFEFEVRDR